MTVLLLYWQCYIFGSGTDLISLLIFSLLLLLFFYFLFGDLFKKAQGPIISDRIGMKFDTNVHQVNIHRLTELDF